MFRICESYKWGYYLWVQQLVATGKVAEHIK